MTPSDQLHSPETACLPSRELARSQSEWLASARSRLLRRADIARRKTILELGTGWGDVSEELERRSGGTVIALDRQLGPLDEGRGAGRVAAQAEALPLAAQSCDLVFSQCTLMWAANPERVLAEAVRVLRPGGAIAAIEPDYGGLMEWPREAALKSVWLQALSNAGADPLIGRKLPSMSKRLGLRVDVQFFDRLETADPARFDLLLELPLTSDERKRVEEAQALAANEDAVAHLPFWMVYAD